MPDFRVTTTFKHGITRAACGKFAALVTAPDPGEAMRLFSIYELPGNERGHGWMTEVRTPDGRDAWEAHYGFSVSP